MFIPLTDAFNDHETVLINLDLVQVIRPVSSDDNPTVRTGLVFSDGQFGVSESYDKVLEVITDAME